MNRKKLFPLAVLTAALLLVTIGAYGADDDERDRNHELVDVSEILRSVSEALDEIPWAEIQGEIRDAMDEVDWDEINDDVRGAMGEVRDALAEIDVEIGDAMDEADVGDEVRRAVREALRGVEGTLDEIRKERRD